jgi:inorganic pyrophosphatase
VLTRKPLKSSEVIDTEPIGMFEEIEDGEEDHKILAVPVGENWVIDDETENILRDFSARVFSHMPDKKKIVGRFLGAADALQLIEASKDPSDPKASARP